MVVGFVPYEDASKNPATQQYLDEFAKYKPDGKSHAALGMQTWSAWLLFAKAAAEVRRRPHPALRVRQRAHRDRLDRRRAERARRT